MLKYFGQNCIINKTFRLKKLQESVNTTLDTHAPKTKRYVRANHSPFMNKSFNKETMKRSCLKNEFLNTKSDINRKACNKQRSRTFWVTIKPFLLQKVTKHRMLTWLKVKKSFLVRT